jgi:NADH:ubiquinone oxidoreductase subunit 6 (subunit J)
MVEQRHLGTLYTVISVLSYTGVIAGEPLFAAAFRWGMSLGHSEAWVGMPFLIAAACFMLGLVIISVITVPADAAEAGATSIEHEISPDRINPVSPEE